MTNQSPNRLLYTLSRALVICAAVYSLVAPQFIAAADTVLEQCLGQTILHDNYTHVVNRYLAYDRDALGKPGAGYHSGIDYEVEAGAAVYSPIAGKVHKVDSKTGVGMFCIQESNTGRFFIFLHLSSFALHEGDNVSVGSLVGKSGMTGAATEYLHVEYAKIDRSSEYVADPKLNENNFDPASTVAHSIIDTRHASFAGVAFKTPGADAIAALPFKDDTAKRQALAKYDIYLEPPAKKIAYIFPMPGATEVKLNLNMVTGEFSQVIVSSNEVKTSEGLGIGSSFKEWCDCYGEPEAKVIPDGRTQYSFRLQNTHLSLAIYEKDRPAKFFLVAHDLKPMAKDKQ
jgi:hypothetical protein